MLDRAILSAEHAALADVSAQLRAAVASPVPAADAVTALRWRMRRLLGSHLAKEDMLLYPRLRDGADPVAAALAKRFADEMGGLSAAYQRYMCAWDADRIAVAWQAFGEETCTVLDALDARIAREETELYPLLGRAA